MINLHPDDTKTFDNMGLKVLQPIIAIVRKEDNGDYYLDLRDKAANFDLYRKGRIISVDTPWGKQGFRVDNPKLNGSKVDVKAPHVFYDSNNYIIADAYVVNQGANYALQHLNNATDIPSPFTTISDVTAVWSLRSVRDSLYEAVYKVIERWGGHLERNNWSIGLRDTIGEDRGVTVAYAKNIRGFVISEKWDDVTTKLLPVGKDGILLDGLYVENDVDDYPTPFSRVLSFEQDDINEDDYKDEEGNLDDVAYKTALRGNLLAQATSYLITNHVPKVNYSVDAFIEGISDIGDIIRVDHPLLRVPLVTNVIAMEYDAIADEISKVEFGNFNQKLETLISDTDKMVENTAERTKSEVTTSFDRALEEATSAIRSVMNNSYVIYDGDQILVVDSLPKESATNVIRFNSAGIGFSNTGINGTFNSAWTIEGVLDMQQVNAINLVADNIKGGTLRLGFYEGNNGLVEIYDQYGNQVGKIDYEGQVYSNPNGDRLEISPVGGISAFSTASGVEEEVFSIDRDVTNIAKLHARDQIEMPPLKIVPIMTGVQAGWAWVKLDTEG